MSVAPWSNRLSLATFGWRLLLWFGFVLLMIFLSWRTTTCTLESTSKRGPISARAVFFGLIAFVGLGILLLADDRGAVLANVVKGGDEIQQWGGIIPLTAQPVCLTGTAFAKRPGPYMYLGKAGNRLVLYDPSGMPKHPLDPDHPFNPAQPTSTKTLLVPEGDSLMTFLNTDIIEPEDWNAAVKTCRSPVK